MRSDHLKRIEAQKTEHVWYKCKKVCVDSHCQFCDGGLGWCTVCGAFEGQLLNSCPGFMLNEQTLEACYTGNVIELTLAGYMLSHKQKLRHEGRPL